MKLGPLKIDLPAAVLLAALVIAVAMVMTWGPEDSRGQVATWIERAVALLALFTRGLVRLDPERKSKPPSNPPGPPTPLIGLLVLVLALSACGSIVETATPVARAMHTFQAESGPRLRALRRTAMRAAGARVHDAGGTEGEALEAAAAEGRAWQCALDAHRAFSEVTGAFIDVLFLATVERRDVRLSDALGWFARGIGAYRSLSSCLQSRNVSVFPELPEFMRLLPDTWLPQLPPTPADEGVGP